MKLPKKYYPTHYLGCEPIHEVRDWCYVRKIIRAARRGDSIPPIVIEGSRGNGFMLTGTHRSAANDIMVMLGDESSLIEYVTTDELDMTDDLREAIESSDYETIDWILDRQ